MKKYPSFVGGLFLLSGSACLPMTAVQEKEPSAESSGTRLSELPNWPSLF